MEINYIAIVASAIVAMVLGFLWYGPLFGKKWMQIIGVTEEEAKSKSQQGMAPLYLLQFVLVLLQAYILVHFVKGWTDASGIETAVWVWLGFVMPTLASSVMWTNESKKQKIERFAVQAGYHLILLVAFGYILGTWR